MKEHLIEVTYEDIKMGIKCSPARCPIANALRRQLKKNSQDISVGRGDWSTFPFLHKRALPSEATEFILNFDDGHKMKPFSFKITY